MYVDECIEGHSSKSNNENGDSSKKTLGIAISLEDID
jgi:hypothetical protein